MMMMMAEVEVNVGESIESALKRFKKKIQKAVNKIQTNKIQTNKVNLVQTNNYI